MIGWLRLSFELIDCYRIDSSVKLANELIVS